MGLSQAASGRAIVEGETPMMRLRFSDVGEKDRGLKKRFSAAMAARGVLWHPDLAFVTYAHTRSTVDRVVEAAASSFNAVLGK